MNKLMLSNTTAYAFFSFRSFFFFSYGFLACAQLNMKANDLP